MSLTLHIVRHTIYVHTLSNKMQKAYLPTMQEDLLQEVKQALKEAPLDSLSTGKFYRTCILACIHNCYCSPPF